MNDLLVQPVIHNTVLILKMQQFQIKQNDYSSLKHNSIKISTCYSLFTLFTLKYSSSE
jgi:hypothetical protein